MATLRIPVSEQIHQWVRARAKRNGRSMSAEVIAIIEEALGIAPSPRRQTKPHAKPDERRER